MTKMLQSPVVGDCAWHGPAMARDTGWVHSLTTSDIAEIDAALAETKAASLPHLSFGKDAFPLPTLGPKIEAILAEVQHGRGLERLGGGEEGVCQQDQPRGRRGRAREARGGEGLLLREGRGVSD